MVLTPSEARAFYDRFGEKQDSQKFYEDPALDALIAHARFVEAMKVLEFGCGTGRLAVRLLSEFLTDSATYLGCDASPTMAGISTKRLTPYGDRARVILSDGAMVFPLPDRSVDRVIATYVLDLLADADIRAFLHEAQRVLTVGGKLCLVGLTRGTTFLSRVVSSLWSAAFRLRASLVGGCRPICMKQALDPGIWQLEYRRVVIAYGVPSEVLIAAIKASTQEDAQSIP